MRNLVHLCILLSIAVAFADSGEKAGRYLESDAYVANAFADTPPPASTLWLSGALRDVVERALGHRYAGLRVRYWDDGESSVWILDEIGKELPITIGVTVQDATITNVRVLEFRESRGWEVRYPFFTDQFQDTRLGQDGHLNRPIDGITGATLSVGAVTRVAQVALILDDHIRNKNQH
jgi:hypothetical protein